MTPISAASTLPGTTQTTTATTTAETDTTTTTADTTTTATARIKQTTALHYTLLLLQMLQCVPSTIDIISTL